MTNDDGEDEFDILERAAFLHPDEDKLLPKHVLTPLMHSFLSAMDAGSPACPAIGISLSGGVDSMVIAYLLVKLAPRYNNFKVPTRKMTLLSSRRRSLLCTSTTRTAPRARPKLIMSRNGASRSGTLHAVMMRGASRNLVRIECYVRRIDECQRATTKREEYERISRDIRYTTYAEVMARHNIPGMCVGHHRGDVQENVISNMMKGQSLLGLNGMSTSSTVNGVRIWRPLLAIDKDAIFDFAHVFGVPYMKDTTPQWSTRGKLRRQLMPLLHEMYGAGTFGIFYFFGIYMRVGYLNNLSNLGQEATECASVRVGIFNTDCDDAA